MANSGGRIVDIVDGYAVRCAEPHGLSVNDRVRIHGSSRSDLNGVAKVVEIPVTDPTYSFQVIWYVDPVNYTSPVQRVVTSGAMALGGYWMLDTAEADAACGACHNCRNLECLAHAAPVFRWRGNYDFTDRRDITQFPLFHHKLTQWQESPTSLLWRITSDIESCEYVNERRYDFGYPKLTHDPDVVTANVRAYWSGLGLTDQTIAMGPVRQDASGAWLMYDGGLFEPWNPLNKWNFGALIGLSPEGPRVGTYAEWTDTMTSATGGYGVKIGRNLYEDAARTGAVPQDVLPIAFGFPFADWRFIGEAWENLWLNTPAYTIADATYQLFPWRLEIGAIRCDCNKELVTWPKQYRREIRPRAAAAKAAPDVFGYPNFDPYPSYRTPWWQLTPSSEFGEYSTHKHRLIAAELSHPIDGAERIATWWNGSSRTPFSLQDVRSSPCRPDAINWYPAATTGNHSAGHGDECGTLATVGTYSSSGATPEWFGWAHSVNGAQTLDAADYANADVIVLRQHPNSGGTVFVGYPEHRYQPPTERVAEWLALGGKCLILENPGPMMQPNIGESPDNATSANAFLAGIGSSIQFAGKSFDTTTDGFASGCFGLFGEDPLSVTSNTSHGEPNLGATVPVHIYNPIVSAPRVLTRLRIVGKAGGSLQTLSCFGPAGGWAVAGGSSFAEAIVCAAETVGDSLVIVSSGYWDDASERIIGTFFPGQLAAEFGDRIREEIGSPAWRTPA